MAETSGKDDFLTENWIMDIIKTPVGTAVIGIISTGLVGGFITFSYNNIAKENDYRREEVSNSEKNRLSLINSISETYSERRANIGLLRSALAEGASDDEIKSRWGAYQVAYMNYNKMTFTYKTALLTYLGAQSGEVYWKSTDDYITPSFSRIDACVTKAYYSFRNKNDKNYQTFLDACPFVKRADGLSWSLKNETDALQKCLGTYETELMYSMYIENNFNRMRQEDLKEYTNIANRNYMYGKQYDAKNDKYNHKNDWVYFRILSRDASKNHISEGCASLARQNYSAPDLSAGN